MDQALRNQLQRTTQAARTLLEQEFAAQLEGTYDILPDGTIAKKPGPHLDADGRLVRQKLAEAVQHRIAGGQKAAEAVADYKREAAFTCLNRFVALKMLEARELVQTCVSKGEQSGGFREFCGLAPGLSELPDGGYQLYLESLCDELSVEVKVLFDRRDPASLLWPRRQALTDLLVLLNDPELASAWIEDETIGWVYQYFNSQEERRQMREESSAPRNSRELAVRNQFFTPRYVVQFLTDNTLGRTWYQMRQGKTALVEKCQYLVRHPVEVFLKEAEKAPETSADEDLSQQELLLKPVYVPFRPKKDPRDLKILDPACGSGQFLLYCFDLLDTIYEEAWNDASLPLPACGGEVGGKGVSRPSEALPLREAYPTPDRLRAAVPSLILLHNLHGIDIDPRCAQIAAFALWMRAQRAYNELMIDRANRPPIRKTNIVVAEPMPGEKDLLREFASTLQPKLLGQLVEVVFDKMKMAGEAGSLLKIEEELAAAISAARKLWVTEPKARQQKLFVDEDEETAEQLEFDLSGVTDEQFWQEGENLVLDTIQQYARGAENGSGFRRQLFAEDATCGFAFIDLCRQRYDVVLMNPPFGTGSLKNRREFDKGYPRTRNDLYAAFVERGVQLLYRHGMLGAITSRTGFFLSSFQKWREELLLKEAPPVVFADLGYGVLDSAMVEVAAYCLEVL